MEKCFDISFLGSRVNGNAKMIVSVFLFFFKQQVVAFDFGIDKCRVKID
jgi:hypothetical protein